MVGARVIDADARVVRPGRAPAGRLCLPRQRGDELILGLEPFLLVDDGVWCNKAAEASLVAGRSAAHARVASPAGRHAGYAPGFRFQLRVMFRKERSHFIGQDAVAGL